VRKVELRATTRFPQRVKEKRKKRTGLLYVLPIRKGERRKENRFK